MSHTVCIYTVMIWSRFQIAKTEIVRDKYLSISYSRECQPGKPDLLMWCHVYSSFTHWVIQREITQQGQKWRYMRCPT